MDRNYYEYTEILIEDKEFDKIDKSKILSKSKTGYKDLAYEYNGNTKGYFTTYRLLLNENEKTQLQRLARVDKNVIKFNLIKVDEKVNDLEFEKQLTEILDIYDQNWIYEPLDGDEVDSLIKILRNQLNLLNGNITNEEYLQK